MAMLIRLVGVQFVYKFRWRRLAYIVLTPQFSTYSSINKSRLVQSYIYSLACTDSVYANRLVQFDICSSTYTVRYILFGMLSSVYTVRLVQLGLYNSVYTVQ